jgi:hypothetical protein
LSSELFGTIEAWGRVIPATHGFRAQFARVTGIVNTGYPASRLAKRYGVPLIKVKDWYNLPRGGIAVESLSQTPAIRLLSPDLSETQKEHDESSDHQNAAE